VVTKLTCTATHGGVCYIALCYPLKQWTLYQIPSSHHTNKTSSLSLYTRCRTERVNKGQTNKSQGQQTFQQSQHKGANAAKKIGTEILWVVYVTKGFEFNSEVTNTASLQHQQNAIQNSTDINVASN
jgi:hypothetical protein